MDNNLDITSESSETPETAPELNLGKEMTKALAIGTASSAGMLLGFMAIGYAYTKFEELKEKKKAKKAVKAAAKTEDKTEA